MPQVVVKKKRKGRIHRNLEIFLGRTGRFYGRSLEVLPPSGRSTGEQMAKYNVPADVPNDLIDTYIQNMNAATAGTGKMNLFACDQKIEHFNDDFYDGVMNTVSISKEPVH